MSEFQHGLFGCFDNFTICIVTFLVPCVTAGKNAEKVGESCLLCGLVLIVPLANIICSANIRGKIRESKGIEGSFIKDLLLHFCCLPCALCQGAQEVGSFDMAQEAKDVEIQRE